MKRHSWLAFFVLLIPAVALAQSKKELKTQNEDLKRQYRELERLKTELEQEKHDIEKEKIWLKEQTAKLYEDNLKKQRSLEKTETVVKETKELVEKTRDELRQQSDSISDLKKLKELSEIELDHQRLISENQKLEIEQQRLQTEKQKSAQLLLLIVLAFILSVAGLLFYLWIARRKAGVVLEKEKKRTDDLLLNILPAEIAEELKHTGKTKAKSYAMVTVLFADIKNFTKLSENLTPDKIIEELDFVFGEFDKIIERHNIEKIKVIGDAYMCAGGIPVANTTNPFDVVSAAREMQAFMNKTKIDRKTESKDFMELRIGIHTGPVVAGVIGTKKFTYDIWGDAVNTASRMESAGEPNRINISKATYDIVKDKFVCTSRGKIEAKNKGEIEMFFVD